MIAPEANPHLHGHEAAERTMLRAWRAAACRRPGSCAVPRGVGKATLAYRFARRLLAGADHELAATDPGHAIFRMVVNRAHPDLPDPEARAQSQDRQAARDIIVDQVRDAEMSLHETAARGGWKVADRRSGRRAEPERRQRAPEAAGGAAVQHGHAAGVPAPGHPAAHHPLALHAARADAACPRPT